MASSSLKQHVRSPQQDVFKPRFPLDPFASAKVREPWFVKRDQLPVQARRDVILILGGEYTLLLHSLAEGIGRVRGHGTLRRSLRAGYIMAALTGFHSVFQYAYMCSWLTPTYICAPD